ncbi:MBL fold metallo-hydrolase [Pontixanthobacter sp. CEM42]|uniref:MBL fold metallo-hydrolase n=1 Tax=Pontixanthobacter sp. CEM42 TaxID=2792077 RepID=UPI001FD7428A|nr:MBL fold metallo-hydrolase [Pontixanthobacter sp. CEM42]
MMTDRIKQTLTMLGTMLLVAPTAAQEAPICQNELVVLGAGQDAGAPQIGNADDDGPRLLPSSLALIDRVAGKRYLFDATPAITEQLAMLDAIEPPKEGLGIDGIFLTHAHIGHYLGLVYLGREAAGAKNVPVYAMPRMAEFLRTNGPWSQLVELENIDIQVLSAPSIHAVDQNLIVAPFLAPHRDEYSETVGYVMIVAGKSVMYLPDFDSWQKMDELGGGTANLTDGIEAVFIDATFYDDNELPGRDMSQIPHPRVTETMDLLKDLPPKERAKVHFIHYNHTNPIRDPESAESREVGANGFNIARRGDRFCLD